MVILDDDTAKSDEESLSLSMVKKSGDKKGKRTKEKTTLGEDLIWVFKQEKTLINKVASQHIGMLATSCTTDSGSNPVLTISINN